VESGEIGVNDIAEVEATILPAYVAGLAREGLSIDPAVVRRAYDVGLVLRCAFTALPLEPLAGPPRSDPATSALFVRRAKWARLLIDRGLS
jgi:hypothetical protein